jgi:site-specific recombinase XerD
MEYAKTKDILHVKELLGHKNIGNTLKYIHLANALTQLSGEYAGKVATTVNEACALIEQGFEYVCEMDGKKIFRKRK